MNPKKLTVRLINSDSGFVAVCDEFGLTGAGDTKDEAIECLVLALRSTMLASARALKDDPDSLQQFAEIHSDLCPA